MRHSLVLAVPIVGSLALLVAAVTIAASADPLLSTEPSGVESTSLSSKDLALAGPLMAEELFRAALGAGGAGMDAQEVVGHDTIRYRVCKDLTICYLEVPAPSVGIAVPVLPPDIGSPVLMPVEVFAMPPPVLTEQRWALLGLPLLGLAGYGLLGNDEFTPPGQGGGGGGGPPGTEPSGPEPPGPEPPGPEPPGPEPPGPEPPGPEPPGPEPPGPEPPGPEPPGPEPPTNVVPEPASLILLGTGLAGLAVHRRLRRREREDRK